MKILLAAALALAVAGTGCVVVAPRSSRSAASAKRCPPGHQWSDGRCHSTGKGNDPAKRDR
jgi:hypothetical protein